MGMQKEGRKEDKHTHVHTQSSNICAGECAGKKETRAKEDKVDKSALKPDGAAKRINQGSIDGRQGYECDPVLFLPFPVAPLRTAISPLLCFLRRSVILCGSFFLLVLRKRLCIHTYTVFFWWGGGVGRPRGQN